MDRPSLDDALLDQDAVLRALVTPSGRLTSIPTRIRKRIRAYWRAGGTADSH